jgi:hypothetical protein
MHALQSDPFRLEIKVLRPDRRKRLPYIGANAGRIFRPARSSF